MTISREPPNVHAAPTMEELRELAMRRVRDYLNEVPAEKLAPAITCAALKGDFAAAAEGDAPDVEQAVRRIFGVVESG